MNLLNKLENTDILKILIQKDNFAGWVYSINYENALVITNDDWKLKVNGIPHNCFLIASSFDPDKYSEIEEIDKQIILLRVIKSSKLPQDDEMIKTKIEGFQKQKASFNEYENEDYDVYTKSRMQYSGLECRVLGTFYMKDEHLVLGSDIESFYSSLKLNVYVPKKDSLKEIVNYVDPIRRESAKKDFEKLGIKNEIKPFKIGSVRYTSTDRLHRTSTEDFVDFMIQPADFLARRTAVLGMTRTGKSNMIKQTISVVKNIADECNIKIGQLIYDINGEYANANQQDNGSISDIYANECIRYRMVPTEGFKPLLTNFYEQIEEGFQIICDVLSENSSISNDLKTFTNISLFKPDDSDVSAKTRYKVKLAIYKALLKKAKFDIDLNHKVYFDVSQSILDKVGYQSLTPNKGISLDTAIEFFEKVHSVNSSKDSGPITNSKGHNWLDEESVALLNILTCKNSNGTPIYGLKALYPANIYHTKERKDDVAREIYNYLIEGKIVILDLSVGHAILRETLSKKIAKYIFNESMNVFTQGGNPTNIVFYIEEAHNLIGKKMELTDTWPRLAKEGAKYKIALVYATQEVSSVHPNILANTENWFVTHLNSEKEINELAKFYDFSDFSQSLLRSQDVGFARVKTLSSPFVIPIQIDKFNPSKFIGE